MSAEPNEQSVREWVKWYIDSIAEDDWLVIPYLSSPKSFERPTINIKHTEINAQPAAPLSDNLVNDVVVTITNNRTDLNRAEDALDDSVLALVYLLKNSKRLVFQSAKKVSAANEINLAWDINIQVLTTKPTPEEE